MKRKSLLITSIVLFFILCGVLFYPQCYAKLRYDAKPEQLDPIGDLSPHMMTFEAIARVVQCAAVVEITSVAQVGPDLALYTAKTEQVLLGDIPYQEIQFSYLPSIYPMETGDRYMMFLEPSNFAGEPENYYLLGSAEATIPLDGPIEARSKTGERYLEGIKRTEKALLEHIASLQAKQPVSKKTVVNKISSVAELFDYCDSIAIVTLYTAAAINDRAAIADFRSVHMLHGEGVSTNDSYVIPTAFHLQSGQRYIVGFINTETSKTIAAREGAVISEADTQVWEAAIQEAEKRGRKIIS